MLKTLLLTDLVESTRLVERLGDAKAHEILVRHDRLARDLLERWGGREIDKSDGFLLLFQRPSEAVEYALAYHAALRELSAEAGVDIEARAGIHLGEVFLRENSAEDVARGAKPLELEGLAKPLAARTMSLAEARQTLLTRTAYELARRAFGNDDRVVRWISHGSYRFKGVEGSVQVFEVGEPEHAPLSKPRGTQKARRPFRRYLAAAAILLAVLAAFFLVRYRDGLVPESRPSLAVLGFKNNSGAADASWLSTAFSEMLTSDLAAGGQLRLIPGESIARLKQELGLPEVDAFASDTLEGIRASLGTDYVVLGSYQVVPAGNDRQLILLLNVQSTEEGRTIFSQAVDGKESGLFDLVARASSTLRSELGLAEITTAEAAGVEAARSRSLRANQLYSEGLTELRSYDALAAKDLLEEAVATDPAFALAYSALSQAWLALGYDGQAEETARRAFELSEDMAREQRLSIEGRYHEASGELLQAAETYGVLWGFFPDNVEYGLRLAEVQTKAGDYDRALGTIVQLRRLPAPVRDDPRIDLAEALAAARLADFSRSLLVTQEALQKGEARQAGILLAEARQHEGWVLSMLGRIPEAVRVLEDSQRLFAAAGNRGGEARVLNTVGNIFKDQGELATAREYYGRALEAFQEIGDRARSSMLVNHISHLLSSQGDLAEAREMLEESIAVAREIGDRRREAARLHSLALLFMRQGKLEEAWEPFQRAIELNQEVGGRTEVAWGLHIEGILELERGNVDRALELEDRAAEICAEIGHQILASYVDEVRFRIHLIRGDVEAAEESLRYVEEIRSEVIQQEASGGQMLLRARLHFERGRFDEAVAEARQASETFQRQGMENEAALSLALAARGLRASGHGAAARGMAERLESMVKESQSPRVRLEVSIEAARLRALGGQADALETLQRIRTEAEEFGLVEVALEARLAAAEGAIALGRPVDGARLAELAADAGARGFSALADRAAGLTEPAPAEAA